MKKIIKNKVYDTETAKKIGSTSYGESSRDFSHWSQVLYRKKTGEYFLYGEGGPMSRYAKSCGQNNWSGSEALEPVSYENARAWAEEYMDADAYQDEFGEVAEDDSRTQLCISLSADLAEKARKRSAAAEMSLSAYIASLISAD